MRCFSSLAATSAIAAFSCFVGWTPDARACGGNFCDQVPSTSTEVTEGMPVDQTGETIIFVVDQDQVEAHIQIQYDPETDAERFAWIVPVMAEPEIMVGSEKLFLDALNATVPAFGLEVVTQSCGGGGGGGGGGDDGWDDSCSGGNESGAAGGDDGDGDTSGVDTTGGGTVVVSQAAIGAFESVVLRSQSGQELSTWLADNGFAPNDEALPILDEYIAEGALFVAFKLRNDAETAEIHPVVIRYPGTEPCVPIRLTRIAAEEDMDIRVFFFGAGRVVPTNYRHVELNPLVLDWWGSAQNYEEIVTLAVDAEGADGHAFVTEFAGWNAGLGGIEFVGPLWNAARFSTLTPSETLAELELQGFGTCTMEGCQWEHPLLDGLLQSFLPVPEGVEPGAFYGCLPCYDDFIDMDAWDPAGLASALQERIIAPAGRAQEIVGAYPYVTRMYTTLSPHEMTADPYFHVNYDLPDYDLRTILASINRPCGGGASAVVPAGETDFRFSTSGDLATWPDFGPDMPVALRVEEIPEFGPPLVLLDHEPTIRLQLAAWEQQAASVDPRCGSAGDTDYPGWGDDDVGDEVFDDSGWCACRADRSRGPLGALGAGLMLGLLGLARRRRAP